MKLDESCTSNPKSQIGLPIEQLPPEQTGWLAGARDPEVGRTLALLHRNPAQPWTIAALAREVGISRSVLAERFRHYLGEPAYVVPDTLEPAARGEDPEIGAAAVSQRLQPRLDMNPRRHLTAPSNANSGFHRPPVSGTTREPAFAKTLHETNPLNSCKNSAHVRYSYGA